jgi:CRP-like cAMP-binding protein
MRQVLSGHDAENRLIASLPARERQRLQPFLHETDLPDRCLLYDPGDEIREVWFPHDAVVSTVIEMPEGNSVEVGLTGLEGMTGLGLLHATQRSALRMIVQIAGRATRMSAQDFMREVVAPRGEFYARLLRYADAYVGMVGQIAGCNASHGAEQRVARWLLMAHDRAGRDSFRLTHEFVAAMIGLRRATVTQFAGELRQMGAIEYAHGQLTILDRNLLQQHSCHCYEIVRALTDGDQGG